MPLPTARVMPTALLANVGGRPTQDGLPRLDQLLQTEPSAFVEIQAGDDQGSVASPAYLFELGLTAAAMGFHAGAIEALQDCTARAPDHALAWRKLAELLRLAGKDPQAKRAEEASLRTNSAAAKWKAASSRGEASELETAERELRDGLDELRDAGKTPEEGMTVLRDRLTANPLDAPAMRLLAQLERLGGDQITSLRLLERALDLCPAYLGAREDYVSLQAERANYAAVAAHTAWLVAHAPDNAQYRNLHAYALINTGDSEAGVQILTGLLRESPARPRYWLMYAQALHFLGRTDESVQAYRQCLALQPDMGEAYWGLADLKGNFITQADIAAMRGQLKGNNTLEPESRRRMLYTLGQALERTGDFQEAFAAYEEGVRQSQANSAERRRRDRNADKEADNTQSAGRVQRVKAVFSRENFEQRLVQAPAAARDVPIFVVGLPRAGSTLTEQILASHPQVEGTRELSLIGDITRDLGHSRMLVVPNAYPECILDLTQDQLAALGARYIERSRAYRRTDSPWFVDKRPWNWLEVGLIHLILPQAKIIDIRREPMAACFAIFKQLLPDFALGLDELGRYYNNYVNLMEHWQAVLPGRVHFVQYERLVEDTETEIRRMLEYCGLPFDDACLRYWETDRAVVTPSAQQVRRPIYRSALEQWRNFEPWLGPLRESLDRPCDA